MSLYRGKSTSIILINYVLTVFVIDSVFYIKHIFAAYLLVNYNLLTYTTSCNFYDPNLDDFSLSGCTVGTCSNPMITQCICNHLTSFSSSFNMPKLRTNVDPLSSSGASAAFSLESLNQNPVALAFCIGCLCVYLILFMIALRFDLYDRLWVSNRILQLPFLFFPAIIFI